MPKLTAEVTTRTEVELKPTLVKQLKTALTKYREKKATHSAMGKELAKDKDALEMLFADADEYDALEEGVRVSTPFGEVPMKIVKGKTAKKLNPTKVTKLLIQLGATVKQMEACYDQPKDKKPYLGVWLPDEDQGGDEEE